MLVGWMPLNWASVCVCVAGKPNLSECGKFNGGETCSYFMHVNCVRWCGPARQSVRLICIWNPKLPVAIAGAELDPLLFAPILHSRRMKNHIQVYYNSRPFSFVLMQLIVWDRFSILNAKLFKWFAKPSTSAVGTQRNLWHSGREWASRRVGGARESEWDSRKRRKEWQSVRSDILAIRSFAIQFYLHLLPFVMCVF